ncbi:MAG: CPBP family intramembrane metalloprotease [Aquimonas sp.]|nr:CPBP family intramembrane metalloprotease [Aquimonas sp.]
MGDRRLRGVWVQRLDSLLWLALGLALLATLGSAAQLEAQARAELRLFAAGQSPYAWRFADPNALVGPPLAATVLSRSETSGLQLQLPQGHANLGLRLSGRRVDRAAAPELRLRLHSEQPLRWRLAAASDLRPDVPAGPWQSWRPEDKDRPSQYLLAELLPPLDADPIQLRLQIEAGRGQQVKLQSLSLHPRACGDQGCLPPQLQLDWRRPPASLLAQRDALSQQQPLPRVGSTAPGWAVWIAEQIRGLGVIAALAAGALWVLAALALRRQRCAGRRAGLALLLGAGLPMLLLAFGLPRFPPAAADAALIALWLIAVLILRPRAAPVAAGHARTAWIEAGLLSVAGVAFLVAIAMATGGRSLDTPDGERLLRYLGWVALQQLWLARFVLPHLQSLGIQRALPLWAGLLFCGLHLPNDGLMLLTFAGGSAWAWLALRHGRLLPQLASHAALGLAAMVLLPPGLLRSLEVGGRFVFAPL